MMAHLTVGDVGVCRGMPPDGNPYGSERLIGNERIAALLAFKYQTATLPSVKPYGDERAQEIESFMHRRLDEYTFWFMPGSGPFRQVTDPAEIEWSRSLVDKHLWTYDKMVERVSTRAGLLAELRAEGCPHACIGPCPYTNRIDAKLKAMGVDPKRFPGGS